MVNRAISSRVETQVAEKAEQSKEIEENRAIRELTKGFPKVFFGATDRPYFISFLHDYNKGLNLVVHRVWSMDNYGKFKCKKVLCRKQYSEHNPELYSKCPICETKTDGRANNAYPCRAFLGYVHNLEGETFTPEGSDNTYAIDPVKIIEVRFGRGGIIINSLLEFVRKGLFQKKIFEQKKMGSGKDTSYLPLTAADIDMMGEEVNKEVPRAIVEEHSLYSEDQIAQRILNGYEGVLWDIWEVEPPTKPSMAVSVPEEAELSTKSKGASRKALG